MLKNNVLSKYTFDLRYNKHVPKSGLPIAAQRKTWFRQFMKPFIMTMVLYSTIYLIRDNFKAAQPLLKSQAGLTTEQLGLIGFCFSLVYGIGKFVIDYLLTNKDGKKVAAIMLFVSSIIVICIGFLLTMEHVPLGWLMALWALNGACQSSTGPTAGSVVSNWTTDKSYGRYFGIWSASHNIGGGLAGILALWGANTFFHGHVAGMFIVPAIIAIVIAAISFLVGANRPQDIGWNTPEEIFDEPEKVADTESNGMSAWNLFRTYVLRNRIIWTLCVSDIFVYILRIGVDNWSALRLTEQLHYSIDQGQQAILVFAVGSMIGCVLWGIISDLMKGRPALASLICLILEPIALFFYQTGRSPVVVFTALFFLGFLTFGPQILINISTTNAIPKAAVPVAFGMAGMFSYVFGDSSAKVLLAKIADSSSNGLTIFGFNLHGWNATFTILYVAVVLCFILQATVAVSEEKKIRSLKR